MVKKTWKSDDNRSYKRLISAASEYMDLLGAKRVTLRGSRNSFMAVKLNFHHFSMKLYTPNEERAQRSFKVFHSNRQHIR